MAQNKGLKEWFRKKVVAIKRKPQRIGLVAFVITFLYYALNLTYISNTTAKIQGSGMGLCGFATMLFSILSLVTYSNAFPHRKKVNKPMLILFFVMIAAIFFCDFRYRSLIFEAVFRETNPIVVNTGTAFISKAASVLYTHMILLAVSTVLTALSPVFKKLLGKINTAVDVDGYDQMEALDISEEE
ncbi:MAG: hypothetical protein MSS69_02600 [Spirochaetales bacterium]|nr:hypothetical protein [Spirochaetales bacterium]